MNKKNIYKIVGVASLALASVFVGSHFINRHIEQSIIDARVMPNRLVVLFPGKANQSIDFF